MFGDLDVSKEGRHKFYMSNNNAGNDNDFISGVAKDLESALPNCSESVGSDNFDKEEKQDFSVKNYKTVDTSVNFKSIDLCSKVHELVLF